MSIKEIFSQLNIFDQCRRYGLPLWQCPQFLFLVMGLVIAVSSILAYAVGNRYVDDPRVVALLILLVAAILLLLAFIITRSFEKLAEANRMKSEFISIVSHQLRSPLTNLRWAIELLISGELGKDKEKQMEYFTILKENSSRMAELVSDLLTVSRMETEKISLNKTKFSLEKLIKELIFKFEPFIRSSNAKVKLECENNLPELFGDISQIKLVLENFLDNAIKYIKGVGDVKIKILKKDQNIYFEVADNGVGIPNDDQKYIFQKFFRSGNARRIQTQGSGLGLYICKTIIERCGGKIGFKSKEDKGSTFWFTLPLK